MSCSRTQRSDANTMNPDQTAPECSIRSSLLLADEIADNSELGKGLKNDFRLIQ